VDTRRLLACAFSTTFGKRRYSPEYEAYMKEKRTKHVTKPPRYDTAVRFALMIEIQALVAL